MKKIFTLALFLASVLFAFSANQPYFIGKCNKDALSYKIGEKMTFSVNLVDKDGNILEGQKLKWTLTKDYSPDVKEGELVSSKEPFVLSTQMDAPGFARLTVVPVDDNGKRVKDMDIFDAAVLAAEFVARAAEATFLNPAHGYGVKFETVLPWLMETLKEKASG